MDVGILRFSRLIIVCIMSIGLLCIYHTAHAAYNFDKIRIGLSLNQPVETIRLSNPATTGQPVNLQINTVKWTQQDGKDVYEPTKEIIISPPIMAILPTKTQITRVGWRIPKPITQELAYRMIIQDLTPYKANKNMVNFKVQASIPIFVVPQNPIAQAKWQVNRAGEGLTAVCNNTGNVHIQVKKITLTNANNVVVASGSEGYYVLPNQVKSSRLSILKPVSGALTLTAETDNGRLVSPVSIG